MHTPRGHDQRLPGPYRDALVLDPHLRFALAHGQDFFDLMPMAGAPTPGMTCCSKTHNCAEPLTAETSMRVFTPGRQASHASS